MNQNHIRVQIGSTELHANSNIEQCFSLLNSDYEKQINLSMILKKLLIKIKKF